VVDRLDAAPPIADQPQTISPLGGQSGTGGSCCGTGTATAFAGGKIPTDLIQKAAFKTENGRTIQEVTVTVDDKGYSPAVLVVQKGVPARIKFVGKNLSACNSEVNFPAYGGGLNLAQGQLATPLIPVDKDFVFQCGMAMLHGYVRVVEDLSAADPEGIKAVVRAWKPAKGSGGGGCCG
jgi:hypothetical protein